MPQSPSGALGKADQGELISDPRSALLLYQAKSSPSWGGGCMTSDHGFAARSVLRALRSPSGRLARERVWVSLEIRAGVGRVGAS